MRFRGAASVGLLIYLAAASQSFARVELAPCKNGFAPQQQTALGLKAEQQVYKQMPVLPDSSPVTRYIQQLGNKLTAYAPGYKWPYNFHVANVADINAFALPGGTIFVNLGTIQAAESEAQLAGVMAHEISHVVLQHSVCNAEKQQRVGLLAGIGQIAAGVVLGGAAGTLAQEGIGMTAGIGFLKMSRGAEQQADLMGVGILYDAGYDPHGMSQFFETIQRRYGQGGAQFMSDHPNPGNRTEYVNKEIATFPPRANFVTTSPAFQTLKEEVAGMHAYTSKEVASGAWRRQSPNEMVGNAVNQATTEDTAANPVDMGTPSSWKAFRGDGFAIDVPATWQAYGSKSAAMMAPANGVTQSSDGGAGAVVYGALTDVYHPQGRVTSGAAVDMLVSSITRDNPGLAAGSQADVTVNGQAGKSIECENKGGNNGRGERDWVVAFPVGSGDLRYFVFIAPSPDFDRARPTFNRMLQSIKLQ